MSRESLVPRTSNNAKFLVLATEICVQAFSGMIVERDSSSPGNLSTSRLHKNAPCIRHACVCASVRVRERASGKYYLSDTIEFSFVKSLMSLEELVGCDRHQEVVAHMIQPAPKVLDKEEGQ